MSTKSMNHIDILLVEDSPADVLITREAFVSWPDRVLVTRVSADKPGRISFGAQFKGPYMENSVAEPGRLVIRLAE